jgi:hypothetical protein
MLGRDKKKEQYYDKLGKTVEKILVRDYIDVFQNWRKFMWTNFLRGVMMGFGSVIGATIGIGILLWLLSQLGDIPWLGNLFKNAKDAISQ